MIFGLGSPLIGTAGKLGDVDRIMFDPNTGRAEHLVVKHGLLVGERVVPFHTIQRVDGDGLHVALDGDAFGRLQPFSGDLDRAKDPDYIAPPAEEAGERSGLGFQMDTLTARGSLGYATDKPMGYPGGEQRVPDDRQLPVIDRGTPDIDSAGEKDGEIGELCLGGVCLAREYVNRPEHPIPETNTNLCGGIPSSGRNPCTAARIA